MAESELTASEACRGSISEAMLKANYSGERTILTRRGRPAAAVVSIADLERLKQSDAAHTKTPKEKK